MSASSQARKVAEQMKAQKVERRDAIEKRQQSKDGKLEHQQIEVGGVPAETSGGNSVIDSGKIKAKPAKKAPAKKKAAAKKASKKS